MHASFICPRSSIKPCLLFQYNSSHLLNPRACKFGQAKYRHRRSAGILTATRTDTQHPGLTKHGVSSLLTLVRDADLLLPANPAKFNIAMEVWKAINKLSKEQQQEFVNTLSTSKRRDVEDCVAQVVVYEGRAGVPILKGFKKLFFRHPATKELYGHVDVGYWPLGAYFYPLYFRCNLGVEIFPGTNAPTDVQLEYQDLERLDLDPESVPKGLPKPKEPLWPFAGLTDYMRAIGPDMFVGKGWLQPGGVTEPTQGSASLHFVLLKAD